MLAPSGCGIMRFDTSLSWPLPKGAQRREGMASPQWCFADFRLDPANACLWRGPQPVALTPKAFAVLHYLVTHPDRLGPKETLLDAVWPATAISEAGGGMGIWGGGPPPGGKGAGPPDNFPG